MTVSEAIEALKMVQAPERTELFVETARGGDQFPVKWLQLRISDKRSVVACTWSSKP